MKIAVLKETRAGENRVAITPQVAKSLIQMGNEVLVEAGAGLGSHFSDDMYKEAGALVVDRGAMSEAAMYVQINMPDAATAKELAKGSLWVSLMYHRSNAELVSAFNAEGVSVLSLDAIPRISRAQSMDVLSSQANLAGYRAVIEGAYHLDKIFPMLMTAAGTV
ncbi:MAG: hypothetical protein RLZZ504_1402, partial [Bacteroidota bacterium]